MSLTIQPHHPTSSPFLSIPTLPTLRDLFQYERLEPYLKMKTGYEQLFVGREGTGTPFHNAANWNMFYMVSGFAVLYCALPVFIILVV